MILETETEKGTKIIIKEELAKFNTFTLGFRTPENKEFFVELGPDDIKMIALMFDRVKREKTV